jgi:DNA-directed RNA polymerase specialized sigma24 family protein
MEPNFGKPLPEDDTVSQEGSVTRWLGPLQQGDPDAAKQLLERYFLGLVRLAQKRLCRAVRVADEEDVALSAFDSFCRNAAEGRFPQLNDREDLWRLLAVITLRKARQLLRDESRQKRGGGAGPTCASNEDGPLLEQALSREPSPELAAQMTEEYQLLLNLLGDEQLRQVAIWRMEGLSVEEIAVKLDCAPRTVKRKLHLIRNLWEHEGFS